MTPKQLARSLRFKRAHYPVSDAFEVAHLPGDHWWTSQREHVVNWLNEMDGPGAYGRKRTGLDGRHFWNHFQCAPGLLWVAEAAGIDGDLVTKAASEAAPKKRGASQCAAIRRLIPWELIESALR